MKWKLEKNEINSGCACIFLVGAGEFGCVSIVWTVLHDFSVLFETKKKECITYSHDKAF